jgi:hypothetical protein
LTVSTPSRELLFQKWFIMQTNRYSLTSNCSILSARLLNNRARSASFRNRRFSIGQPFVPCEGRSPIIRQFTW